MFTKNNLQYVTVDIGMQSDNEGGLRIYIISYRHETHASGNVLNAMTFITAKMIGTLHCILYTSAIMWLREYWPQTVMPVGDRDPVASFTDKD